MYHVVLQTVINPKASLLTKPATLPGARQPNPLKKNTIRRKQGVFLLALYVLYLVTMLL